jgi:hypothetical protein
MIYVNKHRSTNCYHTRRCRQVREYDTKCKKITDEAVIERIKEVRDECSFCAGFTPGEHGHDVSAYTALLETDISEVDL